MKWFEFDAYRGCSKPPEENRFNETSIDQWRGGTNFIPYGNTSMISIGHRTVDYVTHIPYLIHFDFTTHEFTIRQLITDGNWTGILDPTSLWQDEHGKLWMGTVRTSGSWKTCYFKDIERCIFNMTIYAVELKYHALSEEERLQQFSLAPALSKKRRDERESRRRRGDVGGNSTNYESARARKRREKMEKREGRGDDQNNSTIGTNQQSISSDSDRDAGMLKVMKSQFDGVEKKVEDMAAEQIGAVEKKLGAIHGVMEGKVDTMQSKMGSVEDSVVAIESTIEHIKNNTEEMKETMAQLMKTMQ